MASKRAVLSQLQPAERKDFRGQVAQLQGENADLLQKNAALSSRIHRLTAQLRDASKQVTDLKEKHRRDVFSRRMRHEVEREQLRKKIDTNDGGQDTRTDPRSERELVQENNAL